jgi:uncharacterized protein YjbJ (UPF0337 family)
MCFVMTASRANVELNQTKEITMNVTFNKDVLTGTWKQVRGKAKQTWGKLTDSDLDRISGRFEELAGLVQQRYGYTKEQAEKEVTRFIEQMSPK